MLRGLCMISGADIVGMFLTLSIFVKVNLTKKRDFVSELFHNVTAILQTKQ